MDRLEFRGHSFGTRGRDRLLKLPGSFVGALLGHQAHAELGQRSSGDHSLCAFACESAASAVYFKSGARPQALEELNLRFAHQLLHTNLFVLVLLFVERKTRPRSALLLAGLLNAVVKSGDADVSLTILQRAQDFGDGLNRI